MLVTINTDASFHKDYNVGAYAFWIVCNGIRTKRYGAFKRSCDSPTDAETKCIINALKKNLINRDVTHKIIINTDSLNSIRILTNDRKGISKYNLFWGKKLRRRYVGILKQYKDIEIEFRHVKAHSNINDKRSYVNEWCDRQAKYQLWKRINEFK